MDKIWFFILAFFWLFSLSGCSANLRDKGSVNIARINAKLGLVYLQQGYISIAKSKLLFAAKRAPYDAEVHDAIGYFFSQTDEYEVAEKHYLYAIKLADEKGLFWHNYGKFLYQRGFYQKALVYFLLAAKDLNYLDVAQAYAEASNAAQKLKQDNLARKYRSKARSHGFFAY